MAGGHERESGLIPGAGEPNSQLAHRDIAGGDGSVPDMRGARAVGHLVSGRYRLQQPIGRGAMGIVWRARDELLDRQVAVKEVRAAGLAAAAGSDGLYQRTLREAKAAARLNHPGVVTVFDVVEEDGRPWIVMELVPARSLDRLIAEDGPLPPGQAARVGADLLSALACAHAAGVLHRDVKPGNVLIGPDERTVLTDFGIATFQGDPALTQAGMVVGTPGFTAPERVRGDSASPASDLWSLGATLYTAVEGRGPFDRPGGATVITAGVISEDAPRAPSAGPLGTVIDALMRADPGQRPDAAAAASLLADAAAEAESGPSYPGGIPVTDAPAFGDVREFPAFPGLPAATDQPSFADLVRFADPPWSGRRPRPRGGRRARVAALAAAAAVVAAAGLVAWSYARPVGAAAPPGAAPPAGYQWHEVTAASSGTVAGFAIAAPASWQITRAGRATYLKPPGGNGYIEISLAPFTYPRPLGEAGFLNAQAGAQGQYPGYRLIAIGTRTFLGSPAAAWRFSWDLAGAGRVDVLELLVTENTQAGTQPYVLTVSGPSAGFPAAEAIFRRALRTFQPLP